MTARLSNRDVRMGSIVAVAGLLALSACSDEHDKDGDEPGTDAGPMAEPDAGQPDGGAPTHDAGLDAGPEQPETCGIHDEICGGSTPVCVDGACVECSPDELGQCAAGEACDPLTHGCTKNPPFALDCSDLPADGACHGGPREVLLAIEASGLVAMFDPGDGRFLGYFKHAAPDQYNYWHVTQGPDQCIWTVNDTDYGLDDQDDSGVERWDTDGTFKDRILPRGRYFDGQDDLINTPRHLAFSEGEVFVTSIYGDPHPRVTRFELDGLSADEKGKFDIVIDDGSKVSSMIAFSDGSLAVVNDVTKRVERVPAGGGAPDPWFSLAESAWGVSQVAYAGGGQILVAEQGGEVFLVQPDGKVAKHVMPMNADDFDLVGLALLGNGQWFFTTRSGVSVLDPASTQPDGQHVSVFDDVAVSSRDFRYVGRACLSNEFVESRGMADAPVASCDEPEGLAILREDFENGAFSGVGTQRNFNGFYERPQVDCDTLECAQEIDATLGADGTSRSMKIVSGTDNLNLRSGLQHELAHVKPSYVGYYVRVADADTYAGEFALNAADLGEFTSTGLERIYSDYGALSTFESRVAAPITPNDWVRVQMRDFDWQAFTYDLYVDCERVADDIPLDPLQGTDLSLISLYNINSGATSWFDEIVIK